MASKSRKFQEHMFSIELNSSRYVKNLSLATDCDEGVLMEGFLGEIEDIDFTEGIMLEINGTKGVLRMDLSKKEWNELLTQKMNRLTNLEEKSLSKQDMGC